jgi:hypothetical protein
MQLDKELTFTHYKEPLKAIPKNKGFGYYGAILQTKDFTKIQCHICGKLYTHLSGHIWQAHKMAVRDYKTKFGIAYGTALVSESQRLRLKQQTLDWLKTLTPEQKEDYKRQCRERLLLGRGKRTNFQPKINLETKNKRGTCPDQLLAKIREVADKIGRTPSKMEFIKECETQRFVHLIYQTFGSWSNALKMLGMRQKPNTVYPNQRKPIYSEEELLEYLVLFTQENNKIPTYTDFNRGYLPSYNVYTRRFGGIEKARQLAEVDRFIN